MRTYSPKASEIKRAWHVIDAEGMVLGRVCTEAARLLRGKHKPIFAPHIDTGDHVIIVNASKVVLTAGKADDKEVIRYSGYPGGLKRESYAHFLARKPADAVRGGRVPADRRRLITSAWAARSNLIYLERQLLPAYALRPRKYGPAVAGSTAVDHPDASTGRPSRHQNVELRGRRTGSPGERGWPTARATRWMADPAGPQPAHGPRGRPAMTLDERRKVLRMFIGEITIHRAKPGATSAEAALPE